MDDIAHRPAVALHVFWWLRSDPLWRSMTPTHGDPIGESFSISLRRALRKEPAKAVALLYAWLTAVGFARMFGSAMPFGINAIDLASPADFLLAGFRDPFVGLVALASALGLYWLWDRSLKHPKIRWVLAGTALVWLVVCSAGSSVYRRAVVTGSWRNKCFAPLPMTILLKKDASEPAPRTTTGRLVLATSGFLVVHVEPNRTLVLKTDSVAGMEMIQRPDQCSY